MACYAFTDNPKQIPAKYRSQAKATQMRSLRGYKNYTPAQTSGTRAHVKRNLETARELQKLNARIYGEEAGAPMVYVAPSGEQVVYRVGSQGFSNLEVQSGDLLDSAAHRERAAPLLRAGHERDADRHRGAPG